MLPSFLDFKGLKSPVVYYIRIMVATTRGTFVRLYTSREIQLSEFLRRHITLPLEQRRLLWENENTESITEQIEEAFRAKNFLHLGQILVCDRSTADDITRSLWDGQGRMSVLSLALQAACIRFTEFPELDNTDIKRICKWETYVCNDFDMLDESQKDRLAKFPEQYDGRVPMILYNHKDDREAMKDIMNGYHPIRCFQAMSGKYDCEKCNQAFVKKDFMVHIEKEHEYKNDRYEKTTSKLYKMMDHVYGWVRTNFPEKKDVQLLAEYITTNVDITEVVCLDESECRRKMAALNTTGLQMEDFALIRCDIISTLPKARCESMAKIWDDVYGTTMRCDPKGYNGKKVSFGKNIMQAALRLYIKDITNRDGIYDQFKSLRVSDTPIDDINRYLDICHKYIEIVDKIPGDRFGRLLLPLAQGIGVPWEGLENLLLPVMYTDNEAGQAILELFVKWWVRTLGTSPEKFGKFSYRTPMSKMAQKFIMGGEEEPTKILIESCRGLMRGKCIQDDNEYIRKNKGRFLNPKLPSTNRLLTALETFTTTIDHHTPLKMDLEHVWPMKRASELSNPELINCLGNLTLFETKNDRKLMFQGNRGSKDTTDSKMKNYKQSASSLTNRIPDDYPDFFDTPEKAEAAILKRDAALWSQLAQHTSL